MIRLDELLLRWQEDRLVAEEMDELERLLQHPEGRRRLVEEFCYIESVSTALRGLPVPMPSSSRLKRLRWPWWAGAAAALLMAVAIAWWWRPSGPGPEKPGELGALEEPNQVIAGQVILDGTPTRAIADGSDIRVPAEAPAVIRLGDGSRAELEPGTQAVLHGSVVGLRQLVELVEGAGSFSVEKGEGQFQVETGVGRVTALGTEFRVRILPGRRLEVAVREGLVEVDQGGRTELLIGGERRVFSGSGSRSPRETRALLTRSSAGTISITRRDGSITLPLAENVRVLVDGKPSQLVMIPPGTVVFLEQPEGQDSVVGIRADGPSAGGEVRAVDASAGTITLVGRLGRGTPVDRVYPLAVDGQVIIDGKPAALADVRPGTRVLLKLALDRKTIIRIAVGSGEPRERK